MGLVKRLTAEIRNARRLLPPPFFGRWVVGLGVRLPRILGLRSLGPADDWLEEAFAICCGRVLHLTGASFAMGPIPRSSLRLRWRNGMNGRSHECRMSSGWFGQMPRGLPRGSLLGIAREIFGQQCYIRGEELAGARQVIDLGANWGIFTLFALCFAPSAKVHVVEAQQSYVNALRANVERNGFRGRVAIYHVLIGEPHDAWTRDFRSNHPDVPTCDLGSLVNTADLCDFLKCDIEGAEFQIITPQARRQASVRRCSLEYRGPWAAGSALCTVMAEHGFQTVQRPHRHLGYVDAVRSGSFA